MVLAEEKKIRERDPVSLAMGFRACDDARGSQGRDQLCALASESPGDGKGGFWANVGVCVQGKVDSSGVSEF